MNLSYSYHTVKGDTDYQWISEYKTSGDLDALGHLYQSYIPLVYGVALKYFKDEERSKDAVMQIFEVLINKVKTQPIKHFRSWLYALSRNYCLMELRKEKNNPVINFSGDVMEFEPFMHHEDNREKELRLLAMEKCIESLSTEQKNSISLFYLQEKCYTEVAEQTGYDIKKVKSYIQNGKRNLKICMEKQSE